MYQPKTGVPCACRQGVQRDNCPECEGTGQRIDFAAVRARGSASRPPEPATVKPTDPLGLLQWHVSGAIERGEAAAIVEVKPAPRPPEPADRAKGDAILLRILKGTLPSW